MASNHVDYGVVIDDAASDPKTKLSTLRMLQKRGQKSLTALGDLKARSGGWIARSRRARKSNCRGPTPAHGPAKPR